MSTGIANQIGPFMHADGAVRPKQVGDTLYRVGIAGAYNAFGLIGPEHNGIFVLDDTHKRVVLDRDTEESSGYNGPSPRQWARLKEVMQMTDAEFRSLIFTHPHSRLAAAGNACD
jgi:hypothetical protein